MLVEFTKLYILASCQDWLCSYKFQSYKENTVRIYAGQGICLAIDNTFVADIIPEIIYPANLQTNNNEGIFSGGKGLRLVEREL